MSALSEVKAVRILNPTSIDLGEYVINPYSGCAYGCMYCYARFSRAALKKPNPWGSFVEVRINAPLLLEKELALKKPGRVLLGSTTECFQPAEKEYRITKKVLEILNRNKVYYVILTRCPDILDSLDQLKKGYCQAVYFTVNNFSPGLKSLFEPKSPGFAQRKEAILRLVEEGIQVIPYFSPLMPWISDYRSVFTAYPSVAGIDFECLNFNLANINQIVSGIAELDPGIAEKYRRMIHEREYFNLVWLNLRNEISAQAAGVGKKSNIFTHQFGDYFKNKYAAKKGIKQP